MKRNYLSSSLPFRYLSLCILLLMLSFTNGDTRSGYNVPISPISISVADTNLDDENDLLIGHKTVCGNTNKTVSILENNGDGSFDIVDSSKTFCGTQRNIFATQINNDNFPDLVAFYSDFSSGTVERYIRIYRNDSGFFNMYNDFDLNRSETFNSINYGNIDGTNQNDLVVISILGQFWGVLYNDGFGNLSAPQYYNVSGFYPTDYCLWRPEQRWKGRCSYCWKNRDIFLLSR